MKSTAITNYVKEAQEDKDMEEKKHQGKAWVAMFLIVVGLGFAFYRCGQAVTGW